MVWIMGKQRNRTTASTKAKKIIAIDEDTGTSSVMQMKVVIEKIIGGYHGRIKIKNSNGLSTSTTIAPTRDEVIDTLLHENEEEVCETCGGLKEVSTMETVHAGEPQTMAMVGMIPCPECQAPQEENDRLEE